MVRGIRSFLAVLAVAISGVVVIPDVDASPAIPVVGLSAPVVDRGHVLPVGVPVEVDLPRGTQAVGLTWGGAEVGLRLRSLGPGGWSRWVALEDEADHGDGNHGDGDDARHGAGPVWTGPDTVAVEIVATGNPPVDLAVHADTLTDAASGITPAGPTPAGTAVAGAPQLADTAPGGRTGTILPSSSWGSPGWSYANCPGGPATTRAVDAVVVHHTATTTGYTADQVDDVLRSIHRFHTRTRRWCDIAYNVLVDRFGRIWEGRTGGASLPIRGGHARGFNTATTGIALLGDFDGHRVPDAAVDAVSLITAWKAAANDFDPAGSVERVSGGSTSIARGRRVVIGRVSGHRDVSSSTCPGRHGHGTLHDVRRRARERLAPPDAFRFGGQLGDIPVAGDWTGDGPGVGVRRGSAFHLRDQLAGGPTDTVVQLGLPGDRPVVGDWDGDGVDTVGVERGGEFHLLDRNRTPTGVAILDGDRTVRPAVPAGFPLRRAVPLAGDWDGDGVDTLGYAADGEIVLFDDPGGRHVARRYRIGRAGDRAVVTDWEADGIDDVGLVRDGVLYAPLAGDHRMLRPVHGLPEGHRAFVVDWSGLGLPTLLTVTAAGDWDPTTPIGL